MKKVLKSYYCGKYFPTSFRGLIILFVALSGLIIINHESGFIKYTILGIVILYSVIVTFSKSYIEIINSDKGLFKNSVRLFFITFGKTKNINDYRYGIIKIVNQVYASPKGAEPWRNRDSEFKIQVAKLWFIKKTKLIRN